MKKALFILAFAMFLAGCGGDWAAGDPDADGARFNRTFRYYYKQVCKYDSFGAYDCDAVEPVSPALRVGLRIDSDGLANLSLDGDEYYVNDHFYYLEHEYKQGYDPDYGAYFEFREDYGTLTVYKDGSEVAYWDEDGYVTFYYDVLFD